MCFFMSVCVCEHMSTINPKRNTFISNQNLLIASSYSPKGYYCGLPLLRIRTQKRPHEKNKAGFFHKDLEVVFISFVQMFNETHQERKIYLFV